MTIHLKIDGMSCGHCVASVKKALESVPGVDSAAVDLSAGSAAVIGAVEPSKLAQTVESEGYFVLECTSSPNGIEED